MEEPSASSSKPSIRRLIGYNLSMNLMPDELPDDPVLLKQMLVQMLSERQVDKGQIIDLKEQITLLRQRLFGRKSEQTVDPQTPQLALFNEPESLVVPTDESDEEVVAPTQRRGKRKPLSADLPRSPIHGCATYLSAYRKLLR